jgi:hypothetical protein
MQTAALTTLREGVIRLALATNTLKFGLPTISHSKDRRKKSIPCS